MLAEMDLIEKSRRKLTVILSADVVGYSRLMGENDLATLQQLTAYQTIIADLIGQHEGRLVDAPGDALLAEFPSPVEAVACAAEIQDALREQNRQLPDRRQMKFRIGINLGDVLEQHGRLYGDGVNVAARLESLADAGGICISGKVFEEVKNKLPLTFEFIGQKIVKNIASAISTYRVHPDGSTNKSPSDLAENSTKEASKRWTTARIAAGLSFVVVIGVFVILVIRPLENTSDGLKPTTIQTEQWTMQVTSAPQLPVKPSVAVLPFENMSGNPEHDYFSDGMTQELITSLSQISGLFVISRISVFAYKRQPINVRHISEELGVRYVLEGSVRRVGKRVRITAQLIDAKTGFSVWGKRFDRDLEDIFAVQDDVTNNIVTALKVKLTKAERNNLMRRYTSSVEAYDYFLQGYQQLLTRSKEGAYNALELFDKAIELDPNFARAHAMLAWTHARMAFDGWSDSPMDSLATARELAITAVKLDDGLPLGHFVLGLVHLFSKEHTKALKAVQKAIDLDPNYAEGYAVIGATLSYAGKPEEGLRELAKALCLDPHGPLGFLMFQGAAYFTLGRYEDAADTFHKAAQRNPNAQHPHMWLAASYAHLGRMDEATWEAEELLTLDPDFSIRRMEDTVPYKDPLHLERLLDGLRKTGLPD